MNFATVDFENFDDNVRFYDSYFIFDFSVTSFEKITSFTSIVLMSDALINSTSHSIHVEIVDLFMHSHVDNVNVVDALYDEEFEVNKRSHVKESTESRKSAFDRFESMTSISFLFNQQFSTQSIIDQQFQFQTADSKSKKSKKNQKRRKFESHTINSWYVRRCIEQIWYNYINTTSISEQQDRFVLNESYSMIFHSVSRTQASLYTRS